ncbi:MAG: hypothetical protein JXR48_01470 [Candidatus Delongbacteria bacterium]|nr:hypothetical protein [Candidatus Delongbacteria bacterium]
MKTKKLFTAAGMMLLIFAVAAMTGCSSKPDCKPVDEATLPEYYDVDLNYDNQNNIESFSVRTDYTDGIIYIDGVAKPTETVYEDGILTFNYECTDSDVLIPYFKVIDIKIVFLDETGLEIDDAIIKNFLILGSNINVKDLEKIENVFKANYLRTFIYDEIDYLENFTSLISVQILNGTGNMNSLYCLPHLRHLEITLSDIKGDMGALESMHKMEHLVLLFNNKIKGDFESLEELANLKYLEYDGDAKGNLSSFSNLTSLVDLKLHAVIEGDISGLANLTKLEKIELWLPSDDVYGNLSSLSNLTNLKYLDFSVKLEGEENDLSSVSELTNLEYLDLSYVDIIQGNLRSLSNLTELKHLDLGYRGWTEYDNVDLTILANMDQLEYFYLEIFDTGHNKFCEFDIDSVKTANGK